MQQANRAFGQAEAQNADNPCYQPYPADAPRHLGLIAEAVLAERAAIREAVASAMAPPGTGPEVGDVTLIIERLRAGESPVANRPRDRSPPVICATAQGWHWPPPAPAVLHWHSAPGRRLSQSCMAQVVGM
jgi:hypothetical protein